MKPETYWLGSQSTRAKIIERIVSLDINGGVKITISDTMGKSAKQRGLQWRWYTDVSLAGIGGKHEDTKNGVHVVSKWRFARRIIQRDDPEQWEFIQTLIDAYEGNQDAMLYIADHYISTEKFNMAQMAEYLTDFERYYRDKGVNLTIPDRGLLEWAETVAA